jgi:uncharacterized protein (DUF1697 family)
MNTYIALFRGINVGGKHSIKMKELIALLQELGAVNVKTYIQSGNAVFQTKDAPAQLSEKISRAIDRRFGFSPQVLILTHSALEKAIADNPFPEATGNPRSLHLGFLAYPPTNPNLEGMLKLKSETEQFHLTGQVFYLYAPEGIGRSKLAASCEKLLGVPMTDRNWKTVCSIQVLVRQG